ncbi:MAG TPA: hypothetical protein VKQ08_04950 [Cyclobacteriaceae bacterium]|nr:hypothetical protein [Cyclobacteriaceae bacterium]
MKTKNVVLTMVAVIAASALTFATTPASKVAVLNQNNSGVYKLIYEGATAGKVTLKIYDNNSNVIFNETKKGLSKFILPLNFNGLEQGEYSIEITDETGTQIQKVSYVTAQQSVAKAVHITKLQNGKYLMSATSNGPINVQIFDGNDNLIHSENIVVSGKLGLVYNLKDVQGQPTFLVK